MQKVNIIIVILIATEVNSYKDFSSLIDVKSLSELPLEALLNIQKNVLSVANNETDTDQNTVTETFSLEERSPQALPFYGNEKIKNKGDGYYVQYVDEDKKYEKKKNVSKIFQSSVTVLAFLAFGGYLLFLIIAAIKGKQNNPNVYDPNTTQIMQAMINAEIHRRKKKRKKPIRGHGHTGYRVEEDLDTLDNSRVKRDLLNTDINIEEMYQALVNLCEGYYRISGYK